MIELPTESVDLTSVMADLQTLNMSDVDKLDLIDMIINSLVDVDEIEKNKLHQAALRLKIMLIDDEIG